MKKWFIFIGGVLTGVALTLLLLYAIAYFGNNDQATLFKNPGDIMEIEFFEVSQVIGGGSEALAYGKKENPEGWGLGEFCLLTNDDGKFYYDNEIIKVDSGKIVRQVGIFQYEMERGYRKTVPIVKIMDR